MAFIQRKKKSKKRKKKNDRSWQTQVDRQAGESRDDKGVQRCGDGRRSEHNRTGFNEVLWYCMQKRREGLLTPVLLLCSLQCSHTYKHLHFSLTLTHLLPLTFHFFCFLFVCPKDGSKKSTLTHNNQTKKLTIAIAQYRTRGHLPQYGKRHDSCF